MRGKGGKEGGTSVDNLTSLVCLKRFKETQVKAADREGDKLGKYTYFCSPNLDLPGVLFFLRCLSRPRSAASFCRRPVRVMRGVLMVL